MKEEIKVKKIIKKIIFLRKLNLIMTISIKTSLNNKNIMSESSHAGGSLPPGGPNNKLARCGESPENPRNFPYYVRPLKDENSNVLDSDHEPNLHAPISLERDYEKEQLIESQVNLDSNQISNGLENSEQPYLVGDELQTGNTGLGSDPFASLSNILMVSSTSIMPSIKESVVPAIKGTGRVLGNAIIVALGFVIVQKIVVPYYEHLFEKWKNKKVDKKN